MEQQKTEPEFRLEHTIYKLSQNVDLILNILARGNDGVKDQSDKLFNVAETADFLGIAIPTVYSMNSRGELPSCKPAGTKRLYFSKKDLLAWVNSGRKQTVSEIKEQAGSYMGTPKKRRAGHEK